MIAIYALAAGNRPDLFGSPDNELPALLQKNPRSSRYVYKFIQHGGPAWFNDEICRKSLDIIMDFEKGRDISERILIGFSKSTFGCFTLTLKHDLKAARIILFDGPYDLTSITESNVRDYYKTDADFLADHPFTLLEKYPVKVGQISIHLQGYAECKPAFDKMVSLLKSSAAGFTYVDKKYESHHWNCGWLSDALNQVGLLSNGDVY